MGLIQLLYKGVVVSQIPIAISRQGHLIKAALSGLASENAQVCHMWKQSKVGACDMGGTTQDSKTDGALVVRYVPSAADELLDGDFITLEHVAIFNVKSTLDGETIIAPPSIIGSVDPETGDAFASSASNLTLTGYAPTLLFPLRQPSVATLELSGKFPTVRVDAAFTPSVGSLVFTAVAPSASKLITPSVGSLILAGVAPTSLTSLFRPAAASLVFTTTHPELRPLLITPSVGSMALTGAAPSPQYTIAPAVGSLAITGVASRLLQGMGTGAGALTLTGATPSLRKSIAPSVGSMVIQGKQPSVDSTFGSGDNFFVATTGSDSNPGTIGSPFLTINYGISQMSSGDTLNIRAGTYSENITQNGIPAGADWDSPTTLRAYDGALTVTLTGVVANYDANQSYIIWDGFMFDGGGPTFANGAHHIKLTNFEIKNYPGNGILLDGDGHIVSNGSIHDGGDTDMGPPHALYIGGTNGLYENIHVYNHSVGRPYVSGEDRAGGGFHVYNSGHDDVNHNIIRNNIIHNSGYFGILLSSGLGNLAYDNVIYNIHSDANQGSGIWIFGSVAFSTEIYNNTIYDCENNGVVIDTSSPIALGCTIYNNIAYSTGSTPIHTSNDTTVSAAYNVVADPSFVDAGSADFHLQAGSIAIGAGFDLSAIFTTDIEGNPFTVPWDVGAYEY